MFLGKWKMVLVSEFWEVFTMVEVVLLSALILTQNLGSMLPVLLQSSFSVVFVCRLV
jgi:hypothetical protein